MLPHWLAQPDVIHKDIKGHLVPVCDITGLSAHLNKKLHHNGINHFFPGEDWRVFCEVSLCVADSTHVTVCFNEISCWCPLAVSVAPKSASVCSLFEECYTVFSVQAEVIPAILESAQQSLLIGRGGYKPRDICVSAPTGSGKTLAFVIPVIQVSRSRHCLKKELVECADELNMFSLSGSDAAGRV